ncbi:MAG: hypothetical protein R3F54_15820 [Alphaproteobacteria bacterium]
MRAANKSGKIDATMTIFRLICLELWAGHETSPTTSRLAAAAEWYDHFIGSRSVGARVDGMRFWSGALFREWGKRDVGSSAGANSAGRAAEKCKASFWPGLSNPGGSTSSYPAHQADPGLFDKSEASAFADSIE